MYIDYEQGHALGCQIQNKANTLKNLLLNVQQIQEKLQPILKESNDQNYLRAIDSSVKVMEKLTDTVNATGELLVNVSDAYMDAMESNER